MASICCELLKSFAEQDWYLSTDIAKRRFFRSQRRGPDILSRDTLSTLVRRLALLPLCGRAEWWQHAIAFRQQIWDKPRVPLHTAIY